MEQKAITWRKPKKDWRLLIFGIAFSVFVTMFHYIPLAGWYLSFVDYRLGTPIFENPFVGLDNFRAIFGSTAFTRALTNTLIFSAAKYMFLFLPPVFAILLNEISNRRFKKLVQTVTTLPHFISWVIIYGFVYALLSTEGPVNAFLGLFGSEQKLLIERDSVYVLQSILSLWKTLGWNSIIYMAAITGIDQQLYEAAAIDGAGYFKKALHVTVPGILPTLMVLLLLGVADILSNGIDQYYVFQNSAIYNKLETLEMYTYNRGLKHSDYSYATAVSMFKTVVSVSLLFITNWIAKKIRGNTIV
jgi:putative aldouronate transport system permease protein